jgi:hypothetical protein
VNSDLQVRKKKTIAKPFCTVRQIAKLLRLTEDDIYQMATMGDSPRHMVMARHMAGSEETKKEKD